MWLPQKLVFLPQRKCIKSVRVIFSLFLLNLRLLSYVYLNGEHVLLFTFKNKFSRITKLKLNSFFKITFINQPCGHVMSHKKFGSDRFSRFWCLLVTSRQTNKQTDKLNLYMDTRNSRHALLSRLLDAPIFYLNCEHV